MNNVREIRNTRYAIRNICHLPSALYNCRGLSTNQLLFMQNKPNVKDAQINVNSLITTDYENISDWTLGQNKANSNPIKPNLKKAKMNVNLYVIDDYRKKDDFVVRINKPNSNPISERPKMNANVFLTKDYENKTVFGPQKTNPIKPNSNPIKACPERSRMGQFHIPPKACPELRRRV